MDPTELALEMAAARKRREEKTATQLREARAHAIRAGMRPGSTREAIEERARSFYPRLSAELLDVAVTMVYGGPADVVPAPAQAESVVDMAESVVSMAEPGVAEAEPAVAMAEPGEDRPVELLE